MMTWAMTSARLLGVAAGADHEGHTALVGPPPLRGAVRPGEIGPLGALVAASGLRGRGGGWFPFVRKMQAVAAAVGLRSPVVVINGMEGEPLSEKDTYLLANAPHLVMDGATLAAEAIGARRIILAVPADAHRPFGGGNHRMITPGKDTHDPSPAVITQSFPAVSGNHRMITAERPRVAELGMRAVIMPDRLAGGGDWLRGVAGERVARAVDPVEITVMEGPGRYLSGQETALVNWINGGPPLPTSGRPFEKGVAGRATLVGNVETFAHLALIARYGPEWYRAIGTPDAPGTMLLTVSGAVVRPGVLEVPVGTPVRDVLLAADADADPVAVLVGGYGGTWLAWTTAAGLAIDPESLAAAGAALGPGVVHVLPRGGHGLVRTAEIARWMERQGAGQCGPCRFGLRALSADLDMALRGEVAAADRLRGRLALLPRRGGCAHPDGVARLVASALAVFGTDVVT